MFRNQCNLPCPTNCNSSVCNTQNGTCHTCEPGWIEQFCTICKNLQNNQICVLYWFTVKSIWYLTNVIGVYDIVQIYPANCIYQTFNSTLRLNSKLLATKYTLLKAFVNNLTSFLQLQLFYLSLGHTYTFWMEPLSNK